MKECEFLEKLNKIGLDYLGENRRIEIPIYYSLDDDDNIILDKESIVEEFEYKLKEVEELK